MKLYRVPYFTGSQPVFMRWEDVYQLVIHILHLLGDLEYVSAKMRQRKRNPSQFIWILNSRALAVRIFFNSRHV
jgi:hypothetical protein